MYKPKKMSIKEADEIIDKASDSMVLKLRWFNNLYASTHPGFSGIKSIDYKKAKKEFAKIIYELLAKRFVIIPSGKKKKSDKVTVNLKEVFGNPPQEVEENIKRMRRWVEKGLPRPKDLIR